MAFVLGLTMTDFVVLFLFGLVIIWYFFIRKRDDDIPPLPPDLPSLKKQDMTLDALAKYNGSGDDKRLLLAIDGKIFDVTRASHLYGKEGPYGLFAGHDASRGLATFSIDESAVRKTYDDLSDLSVSEIDSMKEWAAQFSEKYPFIGRLLRPGEEPDVYTDSEDDVVSSSRTKDT